MNVQSIGPNEEPGDFDRLVGKRIATRRKQIGMTAADVSVRLQAKLLQQRYKLRKQMDAFGENYASIEAGTVRLPSSLLVEICSIIDISVSDLCSGLIEDTRRINETHLGSDKSESFDGENLLIRVLNDVPSLPPEGLGIVSDLVAVLQSSDPKKTN